MVEQAITDQIPLRQVAVAALQVQVRLHHNLMVVLVVLAPVIQFRELPLFMVQVAEAAHKQTHIQVVAVEQTQVTAEVQVVLLEMVLPTQAVALVENMETEIL
jgi:hypothetical protein